MTRMIGEIDPLALRRVGADPYTMATNQKAGETDQQGADHGAPLRICARRRRRSAMVTAVPATMIASPSGTQVG